MGSFLLKLFELWHSFYYTWNIRFLPDGDESQLRIPNHSYDGQHLVHDTTHNLKNAIVLNNNILLSTVPSCCVIESKNGFNQLWDGAQVDMFCRRCRLRIIPHALTNDQKGFQWKRIPCPKVNFHVRSTLLCFNFSGHLITCKLLD